VILAAIANALGKLDPRSLWRSPVMFVVEIVALLTTVLVIREAIGGASVQFSAQIAFWLWFTVVFANLAEAVAEGPARLRQSTCGACAPRPKPGA
jgi:K+-transporting ATPase ATPase B chain